VKWFLAAAGGTALAVLITVNAQTPTDPMVGTWVLNVAKSKFESGPAIKSETRTYEATPDGIRMTAHIETADGKSQTVTLTYRVDGKPYPEVGNPRADAVAITRVSARENRAVDMLAGKVVSHITTILSEDGRVFTMTFDMLYPPGRNVRVYDRE
jgi:hypothetical protein